MRCGGLSAAGSFTAPPCPGFGSHPVDYWLDCWYTFPWATFVWREAFFRLVPASTDGLCYERIGLGFFVVRAFVAELVRWAMIYGVWSTTDVALVGLWLLVGGRYVVDTIKYLSFLPHWPSRCDCLDSHFLTVSHSAVTALSRTSQL